MLTMHIYISKIYFYRPSYHLQKSVDILLHHVSKLMYADNNPHLVAIGSISLYKSDNFSFVYNCVFQ
jgi:hypothetical protein